MGVRNLLEDIRSADFPVVQHELALLATAGSAVASPYWAAATLLSVCYGPHSKCAHAGPAVSPNQQVEAAVVPMKCCDYCGPHSSAARRYHTSFPNCTTKVGLSIFYPHKNAIA